MDRYRRLCERVRAAEAAGRDQRRRTDTRDQRVRLADTRARGGRYNPAAALALCPNCHALVSRGRDRLALKDRLAAAGAAAHTGALDPAPPGSSR